MLTLGVVHVCLSLAALASGLVVVWGMLAARRLETCTALFLSTAVAASATGFGLSNNFGVPQTLGVLSLTVLLVAILARYAFRLAGPWRPVYAVAAVAAVYLLAFFTIGEAFLRLPLLHPLAPTLTEPPFAIAEVAGFAVFTALAVAAVRRFRQEAAA